MKPVKQQFKHEPENGIYGDCHRAAIATVLGLDLDHVPHFLHDNCDAEEFYRREAAFLNLHGLRPVSMAAQAENLQHVLACVKAWNGDDIVYLLGGTSRTGVNHTVVCMGDIIVHDPSRSEAGIAGPCSDGHFWLTFFQPVDLTFRWAQNTEAA